MWEDSEFFHGEEFEGSDPQGESLRKFLFQAYHMLKKVKSAQMLSCQYFHICRVFPPHKKHDRWANRQTCSRFGFLGHSLYCYRKKYANSRVTGVLWFVLITWRMWSIQKTIRLNNSWAPPKSKIKRERESTTQKPWASPAVASSVAYARTCSRLIKSFDTLWATLWAFGSVGNEWEPAENKHFTTRQGQKGWVL